MVDVSNDNIAENLLAIIPENLKLHQMWDNGKKKILFVMHDNCVGGVELHVKDMIDGLCANYNCFLLYKEEQSLLLTVYTANDTGNFIFHLTEDCTHMLFTVPEYKKVIRDILIGFNIDLVHVHHTLGHTLDVFYEAFRLNIPVVITLHDFYYLCPTINLLDIDLNYCKGVLDDERCSNCLNMKLGKIEKTLREWRNEIQQILIGVSKIFVPNKTVKEIYCEYYQGIDAKISVIEHGIALEKSGYKPRADKKEYFNIAFIGNVFPHKGSNIIYDLITHNAESDIRWHIFGWTGGDAKLSQLSRNDLHKHGSYDRNKLVDLLCANNIHLICILSIWPETYCYTLTESICAGIPVLVSDLGALGDRVQDSGTGWIVKYNSSADQILAVIKKIKDDLNKYNYYIETVSKYNIKSVNEMCYEYHTEYEALLNNRVVNRYESEFDAEAILLANRDIKHYLITQKKNIREMFESLRENESLTRQPIGIYIFGTGQGGQVLVEHIRECDYYDNIKGFFDNNSTKWGTSFLSIPVLEPKEDVIRRQDIVIIASQNYAAQMRRQLIKMGIPRDKIIYPGELLRCLLKDIKQV